MDDQFSLHKKDFIRKYPWFVDHELSSSDTNKSRGTMNLLGCFWGLQSLKVAQLGKAHKTDMGVCFSCLVWQHQFETSNYWVRYGKYYIWIKCVLDSTTETSEAFSVYADESIYLPVSHEFSLDWTGLTLRYVILVNLFDKLWNRKMLKCNYEVSKSYQKVSVKDFEVKFLYFFTSSAFFVRNNRVWQSGFSNQTWMI